MTFNTKADLESYIMGVARIGKHFVINDESQDHKPIEYYWDGTKLESIKDILIDNARRVVYDYFVENPVNASDGEIIYNCGDSSLEEEILSDYVLLDSGNSMLSYNE